jgi:hypothetical protein
MSAYRTVCQRALLGGLLVVGACAPAPPRQDVQHNQVTPLPAADGGSASTVPLPPPPLEVGAGSEPAAVSLASFPSAVFGIPASVLAAYQQAADANAASNPRCHLTWSVLAGIGKVESNHAHGGDVDANGTVRYSILGPVLDGTNGTAAIRDTDNGVYDHDTVWDRAVGPMQFIPSTWVVWGTDGSGNGKPDPENVHDAALSAAHYLCANGRDLSTADGLRAAILSYNGSLEYLDVVLRWMTAYDRGAVAVPDGFGSPSPPVTTSAGSSPPANDSAEPAPPAKQSPEPAPSQQPAPSPPPPQQPAPSPPAPQQPAPSPPPLPGPVSGLQDGVAGPLMGVVKPK